MQLFDHSLWATDLSLLGVGYMYAEGRGGKYKSGLVSYTHDLFPGTPRHYSFSSFLFHISHVHIDTTAFGLFRLKKWSESHSVVSDSLQPHGVYSPWNSPGQNSGVGSRSLLQGIFPIQGLNPGLAHCRRILYQLSHKGSPRILEWVGYPFSSGVWC